jgi:CRP-like cAMP-binding protein
MSSAIRHGVTGNVFIDSLPAASANALIPLLEIVPAIARQKLAGPSDALAYAWFPINAVISIVATDSQGVAVEVGLVGKEGLYGASVLMGDETSAHEVVVQIPDSLMRMEIDAFCERADADSELKSRALRFIQSMLLASAQFSLCNRAHPINERCARWLLMAHDRVEGDEIRLTHDYLATMLGVRRRASVTVAVSVLEAAGYITKRNRRLGVVNRAGLEDIACECYLAVNSELERLMTYSIRKTTHLN